MAARKAKTETSESGASEVRAKADVVELDTQPKANSSEPLYVAIMQQITYLMSTITNQNKAIIIMEKQHEILQWKCEISYYKNLEAKERTKRYALLGM